jgi:hypothetical protein
VRKVGEIVKSMNDVLSCDQEGIHAELASLGISLVHELKVEIYKRAMDVPEDAPLLYPFFVQANDFEMAREVFEFGYSHRREMFEASVVERYIDEMLFSGCFTREELVKGLA